MEMENNRKPMIQELILEVTRRCNMSCAHCLRGDAQALNMSKEIIDKVLDSVESIGSVLFTGGEPSLNLEAIRYFFTKAEELEKLPYSFYIVTNGKEKQEALAIELLKWYPKMEEKDMCGVALSLDDYHDPLYDDPENHILRGLAFYREDKEWNGKEVALVKDGRAQNLTDVTFKNWTESEQINEDDGVIEMLYVAANGNLIGSCDMSYEHIDSLSEYTVGDLPHLLKLLEKENAV